MRRQGQAPALMLRASTLAYLGVMVAFAPGDAGLPRLRAGPRRVPQGDLRPVRLARPPVDVHDRAYHGGDQCGGRDGDRLGSGPLRLPRQGNHECVDRPAVRRPHGCYRADAGGALRPVECARGGPGAVGAGDHLSEAGDRPGLVVRDLSVRDSQRPAGPAGGRPGRGRGGGHARGQALDDLPPRDLADLVPINPDRHGARVQPGAGGVWQRGHGRGQPAVGDQDRGRCTCLARSREATATGLWSSPRSSWRRR